MNKGIYKLLRYEANTHTHTHRDHPRQIERKRSKNRNKAWSRRERTHSPRIREKKNEVKNSTDMKNRKKLNFKKKKKYTTHDCLTGQFTWSTKSHIFHCIHHVIRSVSLHTHIHCMSISYMVYGIILLPLGLCIVFGCSVSNGIVAVFHFRLLQIFSATVAIVLVTLMKIELNGYTIHIKYSIHQAVWAEMRR